MRILHGPVNVGNQPWSLSRAERALGHSSDLVVNYSTWLGYPADRVLTPPAERSRCNAWKRARFALSAPFHYDVLHYYFGRSFMLWDDWGVALGRSPQEDRRALADVRLAKALGRRCFLTLQGCDVRIASESNAQNRWTPCGEGRCTAFAACLSTYDQNRRVMVEKLLPLMDRVFYLNPELGRWVPNGDFLPYANVEIDKITPVDPAPGRRLKIVHAPSDPNIKGTPLLLEAFDSLSNSFAFDLVLVQGKTHAEAMQIYREADLAIDQLLAGWYGGFAVELMAMGKPVAAYVREGDRQYVPSQMWIDMPILRLRPDTVREDLARILAEPAKLVEIGRKSREYVQNWHNPRTIAAALTTIYRSPSAPLDFSNTQRREVCAA